MAYMVENGFSLEEIRKTCPVTSLTMGRKLNTFLLDSTPQIERKKPKIIILYGKTGTGKTRYTYNNWNIEEFYSITWPHNRSDKIWWDGYTNQKIVIFDDWTCQIGFTNLLKILDTQCLDLDIKGGRARLQADTYVFSTNIKPEEWYSGMRHKDREPLARKITEWGTIIHSSKNKEIQPIYENIDDDWPINSKNLFKYTIKKKEKEEFKFKEITDVEDPRYNWNTN